MPVAKKLTTEQVVGMMKRKQGKRSLRSFAKELGVSPAFICDIYKGRRRPGEKILAHMGLTISRSVEVEYQYQ